MTIVRVGTSKKYSDNFDAAFGKKRTAKSSAVAEKKPAKGAKKSAKKTKK